MSNPSAPVSASHIQVINGTNSGMPANAAKGSGGDASETPVDGGFGELLKSQIQGLAASLKRPIDVKAGGDKPDAGEGKLAQGDAPVPDGNMVALFAPFTPVIPSDAAVSSEAPLVQSDVRAMVGDILNSKMTGKPVEKETLKVDTGVDAKSSGKLEAAEFAGSGKFSQFVDLAQQRNGSDSDSKVLLNDTIGNEKTTNIVQMVRADGYGGVAISQPGQSAQMPSAIVEPRVGVPGWGDALGQKLVWVSNQAHQVAELHLNPPNLGPLEVRLTMNNDQTTAMFVSSHPAVRDAIESALPRLREMMADNGLTLGNVSVGSQSFSQQQQAFGGNENQRNEHRGSQPILLGDVPSVTDSGRVVAKSWNNGMVDTFA